MKKVEIISMQQVDNYGSVLQAYSLKKMIESLGFEVFFADIEKGKNEKLNLQCAERDVARNAARKNQKQHSCKKLVARIRGKVVQTRMKKIFSEFRNSTELNTSDADTQYDDCVIGSDEVFNCLQKVEWGFSQQLFGNVQNADNVITYAASCGFTRVEMLSEELKKAISEALGKLSAISVRDTNTAHFIQNLSSKEFVYNLDPVAVGDFTAEIAQAKLEYKLPARYCIIYAYSNRISSPEEIRAIRDYCDKRNLKMIAPFGEQEWIPLNKPLKPFELLRAFQEAECIITDTFHRALCGAKYRKRLAIIIRESNRNKLGDLTRRLQIKDHVVTEISELGAVLDKNLDKVKIDEILSSERKKSLEYLKENL